MSANPNPDLQEIKLKLERFRADRKGKKEIPEHIWEEAVALLEHYPFQVVWRELRLKPEYLKRRAGVVKGNKLPKREKSAKFLTLTSSKLTEIKNETNKQITSPSINQTSECRLVIERVDGSRLQLNLPIDWSHIETLLSSFLKG